MKQAWLLPFVALYPLCAAAQPSLVEPPPLPAATPVSRTDVPGPVDEEVRPAAPRAQAETRIEQKRVGNRIVEIRVTPAGSTSSYVIVNREGRLPLTQQELSAGLSTPRFFRFDF